MKHRRNDRVDAKPLVYCVYYCNYDYCPRCEPQDYAHYAAKHRSDRP